MYFTLTYAGDLKANAEIKDKQKLRKAFHSQLNVLWQQEPLVDHKAFYDKSDKAYRDVDLNRKIGAFRFVPLVSPDLHLVCSLKILMLRPEPPGSLITQGGISIIASKHSLMLYAFLKTKMSYPMPQVL